MYEKFDGIVQHPAEMLLTPTMEVNSFDVQLSLLSVEMFEAMRKNDGIGLAANQIGFSVRMAVMQVPGWPEMVLVNPRIVRTKGEGTAVEGCLSVAKSQHRVAVRRAKIVWVEYQDLQGNKKSLKASELLARCIQHEIDHLDGMTCLERSKGGREYGKSDVEYRDDHSLRAAQSAH